MTWWLCYHSYRRCHRLQHDRQTFHLSSPFSSLHQYTTPTHPPQWNSCPQILEFVPMSSPPLSWYHKDYDRHSLLAKIVPELLAQEIYQLRLFKTLSLLSGKRLFYPYMGEQGVFAPTFSGVTRASQETRL
jgi:hypothetical protein